MEILLLWKFTIKLKCISSNQLYYASSKVLASILIYFPYVATGSRKRIAYKHRNIT